MKTLNKSILILFIATLFVACEKPEGEGGKAAIKGSIWTEDWNTTFTVLQSEYAAADVDVYIIYGNNVSYSDRTRANYNGEYEFKFLREGNYKIYVYSKDKSLQSPSGQIAIVKEVKISKKKETVTVDRITIYN